MSKENIDNTYPTRVGQKVWYALGDGSIVKGVVAEITRYDVFLVTFDHLQNHIEFDPKYMGVDNKEGLKKVQQRAVQIFGAKIQHLDSEINKLMEKRRELIDLIDW